MSDLTNLVRDHVEAFDEITQDWQTADGVRTVKLTVARPVQWVERVRNRGVLSALDFLAVIYFALNDWSDSPTPEMESRLVESWATELREAATDGEIKPRDVFTLLPYKSLPAGWDWGLGMEEAEKFLKARDMEWTCTHVVNHIYEQVASDIDEMRFPRFLDENQIAPAQQSDESSTAATAAPAGPDDVAPPVPMQRSAAHAQAITAALQARGYDPKALPKPAPGRSGVKAEVRSAIAVPPLFVSHKAFNDAWQRMRSSGDIADAS